MKINLHELREEKKKNFEERLKFIDSYVEWLKRTPNREWSPGRRIFWSEISHNSLQEWKLA